MKKAEEVERNCISATKSAKMAIDLNICARLLTMIAEKLGHDYLLLSSGFWAGNETWCKAVFGQYDNYETTALEANGRQVWLKNADAVGRRRSNDDMYHELVELVHKTLESGGKLFDGRCEIDADDVPEFMVECALNGIGCLEKKRAKKRRVQHEA